MKEEKYYSMKQLVNKLPNPLPQNYISVKRLIDENKNIFKPTFRGDGKGKRYVIAGSNINKFLSRMGIKSKF